MIILTIRRMLIAVVIFIAALLSLWFSSGCQESSQTAQPVRTVPGGAVWGIYQLDIDTQDISLIYSFPANSFPSGLRLNNSGDRFIFAQKSYHQADENTEIYTVGIDGNNLTRITDNSYWDLYPAWSPDGSRIAFLSHRDEDLDIYMMDADGKNINKMHDSGDNDADIDWVGNSIVFTSRSAIWMMQDDGARPLQITDYPDRGKWGQANLPAGDYDPRLSPDGKRIAFERLENIDDPHGGYNIFTVNCDGTAETRLTSSGYSQGLVNWSHSGEELVYVVAAIDGQGKYDIYIMNADGTNNRNITPDYFPEGFLCHYPTFSEDGSAVFFLGQWWNES